MTRILRSTRRGLASACALLLGCAQAIAGPQLYTPVNSAPYAWHADGYSQFSLTGTATANLVGSTGGTVTTGTLSAIPSVAVCATILVETAAIRWRDDGTAPSTTVGNLIEPIGTSTVPPPTYCGDSLALWQAIAVTGTPVINVSFTH